MPPAEVPISFRESLPVYARDWLWLSVVAVMLTLPDHAGTHTVFHAYYAPQHGMYAHNVATYSERSRS